MAKKGPFVMMNEWMQREREKTTRTNIYLGFVDECFPGSGLLMKHFRSSFFFLTKKSCKISSVLKNDTRFNCERKSKQFPSDITDFLPSGFFFKILFKPPYALNGVNHELSNNRPTIKQSSFFVIYELPTQTAPKNTSNFRFFVAG